MATAVKVSGASSVKQLKLSPNTAFTGVKVFSATMVADRQVLGEKVTAWMETHPQYEVNEILVTQSSDEAFHCIAITVFYTDPAAKEKRLG